MELVEVLFGIGGWIVATLLILIRIRHDRRHKSELDRLKGLLGRFIEAFEKQKQPLNRLVALGQPGSEVREEAVAALQMAHSTVEQVLRAEPQLKADGLASTPDGPSPG